MLLFRAALSAEAKMWKQPKCPSVEEWINKMMSIDLCNVIQPEGEGHPDVSHPNVHGP